MNMKLEIPGGKTIEESLAFGEVKLIPLEERQEAKATVSPARNFDMGEGPGKRVERVVMGGVAGILLDARGRPMYLPENQDERKDLLITWFRALKLYPEENLKELL
jgi:hypothetical protein